MSAKPKTKKRQREWAKAHRAEQGTIFHPKWVLRLPA
jgi:hypothetical protein